MINRHLHTFTGWATGFYKARSLFSISLLLVALWLQGLGSACAAPHLPENVMLRDAEIEQYLIDFLTPIFQAAGLDPSQIKILLFNSREVNAAAGLDFTILVNTGLITTTKNVGQLLGVLAHETGHIAGRHNERLMSTYRGAQLPAIGSVLLAAAAALATRNPTALVAGMAGMDMVENTILSYHRGHEAAADQAAFKYLDKLGWSSEGFYEFMKILHKQEMLSGQHHFAYKRTHPFMIERLRLVERHVETSKNTHKPYPADFELKYTRMKEKIAAYTDYPERILQKYPRSDQSLIARYARAIAYHRKGQTKDSLQEVDALLLEYPNDPYFNEIKGQFLFETGQLDAAYQAYNKAVSLQLNNGLIRIELAHIMLEMGTPSRNKEALDMLIRAEKQGDESPWYWRLCATAYGRIGQEGKATLMLAEESLRLGDINKAQDLATRALKGLKESDTTARQRARDIQTVQKPSES